MRWLLALVALLSFAACDDPNRHPRNPMPPPPESSSSSSSTDGGTGTSPEGGPATAPTIQPQPGDIQL